MESAALIGLGLFIVSEVLPFTPLKGNGIVQEILVLLRKVFPHTAHTERK